MEIVKPQRSKATHPDRPEYFSGTVRTHNLVRPEEGGKIELIGVFFEAGARTIPHVHSTDQALYILEGEGIVATELERRKVRPGDIAVIPAGVWHWHGGTPASATAHLSIRPAGPTNWSVERKNWADY